MDVDLGRRVGHGDVDVGRRVGHGDDGADGHGYGSAEESSVPQGTNAQRRATPANIFLSRLIIFQNLNIFCRELFA